MLKYVRMAYVNISFLNFAFELYKKKCKVIIREGSE